MPKRVYEQLYRAVRRDIETNYQSGGRYLSVREIADTFSVSLQIAQKAITQLKREGVVTSKPRIGILIQNTVSAPSSLQGKKILVLSNKQDYHF